MLAKHGYAASDDVGINKKDTPTLLPKAVLCTLADAQEVSFAISIAPDAGKTRGIQNDIVLYTAA